MSLMLTLNKSQNNLCHLDQRNIDFSLKDILKLSVFFRYLIHDFIDDYFQND